MKHRSKEIMFVVFLLLGMIITMQFRTILIFQQQSTIGQTSVQALVLELDQIMKEGVQLQEQLRKLEEEKDEIFMRLNNDGNPMINELIRHKKEMQLISGFLDVKGVGIVVTLNDAPARNEMADPSELIIHDADITAILNNLRAAGAQALSINNERILATSKQLCAGPTILINQNRYPVPYIIKAIGDPDSMAEALEASEAVVIMRAYNIQVDIKKEAEIRIPRYEAYQKIENMISGMEVVDK